MHVTHWGSTNGVLKARNNFGLCLKVAGVHKVWNKTFKTFFKAGLHCVILAIILTAEAFLLRLNLHGCSQL